MKNILKITIAIFFIQCLCGLKIYSQNNTKYNDTVYYDTSVIKIVDTFAIKKNIYIAIKPIKKVFIKTILIEAKDSNNETMYYQYYETKLLWRNLNKWIVPDEEYNLVLKKFPTPDYDKNIKYYSFTFIDSLGINYK
jgi:hypothetical protein